MTLKPFLVVTAIVEVGAGVCLLGVPAVVLALLLRLQAPSPETLVVGRVAGAALLAIGVASWLARDDPGSVGGRGLLIGALVYDGVVAVLLAYAGGVLGMMGVALWPAVALHTVLTIWGFRCLGGLARVAQSEAG